MADHIDEKPQIDATFNASDPEQVAAKRRSAGKKRKQDDGVVKSIMASQAGRAWMHSLLGSCHCFSMSFTGEALSSAFKEGERNIGNMMIASIMKTASEEFILMLKEHNNDRTSSPDDAA
jgi:hypothetical protein